MNEAIKRLITVLKTNDLPTKLLVTMLLLASCDKEIIPKREQFVFLGHIYQPGFENRIDFRLKDVCFATFDLVLLGGDICGETTKENATLNYLDSIFDLSSESTLWAVGNHDVRSGHIDRITTVTERPLVYVFDRNEVRYLILNTNYSADQCAELEHQFSLMEAALLEIEDIKQIVILSHHAIWTNYATNLGEPYVANARHGVWRAHCRNSDNDFSDAVAPLVEKVADQGRQVLWISGDFGQKKSTYQFMPRPNLYFLGCGLDSNKQNSSDSVLIIEHQIDEKFAWQFIPIEKLPKSF